MRRIHVQVIVGVLVLGACALAWITYVARVRAAHARMNCQRNFKELTIAMHNYESVHGKYPRAAIPNAELQPNKRLSWLVEILGYLNRNDLDMRMDRKFGPRNPANAPVADLPIENLLCPASGAYDVLSASEIVWRKPTAHTHIVGVSGVGPKAVELPEGDPRAGMFGYDRASALNKLPDGISNTLMLMEVSSDVGRWAEAGAPTTRSFDPKAQPYLGEGRPFGGWHRVYTSIGTSRVEGCTMALADGSVRTLKNDISPAILEALATVAGKEPIPAEWW